MVVPVEPAGDGRSTLNQTQHILMVPEQVGGRTRFAKNREVAKQDDPLAVLSGPLYNAAQPGDLLVADRPVPVHGIRGAILTEQLQCLLGAQISRTAGGART